jgi:hypothetical protein
MSDTPPPLTHTAIDAATLVLNSAGQAARRAKEALDLAHEVENLAVISRDCAVAVHEDAQHQTGWQGVQARQELVRLVTEYDGTDPWKDSLDAMGFLGEVIEHVRVLVGDSHSQATDLVVSHAVDPHAPFVPFIYTVAVYEDDQETADDVMQSLAETAADADTHIGYERQENVK